MSWTTSLLPVLPPSIDNYLLHSYLGRRPPERLQYFIAFDQLDLGFDRSSPEYANRLIGLLLASRDINLAAREANKSLFVVVFLRDDIYDSLHFEDKNKMTENYVSMIEWDTQRTRKTLRALMERRFSIVLGEFQGENVPWASVFNEEREMPGHQTKYEHMIDRTYLRPRDIIKFANGVLVQYKERVASHGDEPDSLDKMDNADVHKARPEYSEYFLREIDDEVHRHLVDYDTHLDVLRAIGKWQFDRAEFLAAFEAQQTTASLKAPEALEWLYEFSIIGFYRAGGRGFGGSEYMFRYRENRTRFDPTAARFRVHPGLIEVLGLKRV